MTEVLELPKLWEKAEIKSNQDSIKQTLVGLDAAIHLNAVQCLLHAEKHGDTSLMRRLLVDIVDAKSGYRRQGLIAWMKEFSPMRLDGDVIKLNGMKDGERQLFRCELANSTHFSELASAREMVPHKPIFRDGLTSKLDRAVKEYKDAMANTIFEAGKDPRPKTPGKPYYNGNQADKVEASFDKISNVIAELEAWNDPTKTIYTAQQTIAKAQLEATGAIVEEPPPNQPDDGNIEGQKEGDKVDA